MNRRTKLDIIKSVVNDHQYTKIKMLLGTKRTTVILDAITANQLLKLFNTIPPENIEKLQALPWHRLLNMVWKREEKPGE